MSTGIKTDQDIIQGYIQGSEKVNELNLKHQKIIEESNQALSDLDHILELEELDEVEEHLVMKKRKEVLQTRRKSKDMERVINQILPKQIEGRTTPDRYDYAVRQLGERFYTPRQLNVMDVLGRESNTNAIAANKGGD